MAHNIRVASLGIDSRVREDADVRLNSMFRKISHAFAVEFDQIATEIEHNLISGEARESALSRLLANYLSSRVGLATGFVIDALGNTSRQIDLIIYDKTVGTVFNVGGVKYFPSETVTAVGEVKSDISSSLKLADALANVESVKALDRSNQGKSKLVTGPGISIPPPQMPFDPNTIHRDQILGFIFTSASLAKDNLIGQLQTFLRTHDRRVWPNIYCDWHNFIISFEKPSALYPSAMDATALYCTEPEEIPDLLLLFYCMLASFVDEAHVARPDYFSYACIQETKALFYGLFEGGPERLDGTKVEP
jgi:hypothetical protein